MKLELSRQARDDLRDIHAFIAQHNAFAADTLIARVLNAIERIAERPHAAPVWDAGETRALSIPRTSYRIHFFVDEPRETVTVLTIRHTSRMPPDFG